METFSHEDAMTESLSETVHPLPQDGEEEITSLQQQRRQLHTQRVLLDLERVELEERLSELQLQYTLLDTLAEQLDRQEAALIAEQQSRASDGQSAVS